MGGISEDAGTLDMKQKSVCSIGTKLDARAPSLQWLQTIVTYVDHYLSMDSGRAGAAMLRKARNSAMLALEALKDDDAEGAAFFALGALQAAWTAEMIEGRVMIDGGVTAYRKSETENARRRAAAERERADWRRQAEGIREQATRELTKKEIAQRIASTIEPNPEGAKTLANKIRKHI